jgi:multicomponent Na+:H+ antiporter subunit E
VFAIIWSIAAGELAMRHLLTGFVVSYFVLWWLQPLLGKTAYFEKAPRAVAFAGLFVWELVKSNLRVAWDVVTPSAYRSPAIVAVPLDLKSDAEIALLGILLTLTPGSLTIDVSDDKRVLYVHSMFVDDPETFRQSVKDTFEAQIIRLFR